MLAEYCPRDVKVYVDKNIILFNERRDEEEQEIVYKQQVREDVTKIHIGNNNVRDCVMFHMDKSDAEIRKYPFVNVSLFVEIKEFRKSSDLFNGVAIEDKDGKVVKTWEYKRHRGDWEFYQIEVDNLNIMQFYMGDGLFKIRFKYYCLQNHLFQDWYLRNVYFRFTIKKHLK